MPPKAPLGAPHNVEPPPQAARPEQDPDIGIERPETTPSWAKPEAGWQEKSHKDLSGFEKLKYSFGKLGTKIQALLNAIRQSLTPNSKSSRKILTDQAQVNNINDKVSEQSYGQLASPSTTINKLLDAKGPRAGRLLPSDLTHLVRSIQTDKVTVVDGYGIEKTGIGFKYVANRKPSDVLADPIEGKTTLMPFVLPAHQGSEAHVVLISVDPNTKEIRYFDPKGAHSDDPSHLGAFRDDPDFNMRTDLEALKAKLGDGWTIKENTKAYQRDVTNCGTYVALAMRDEAEGKAVGQDWQTGLTWVNGQKKELAQNMWKYYQDRYSK